MINVYHSLMPRILEIINNMSVKDEKRTCDMFEILEELIEYAVSVVVPHIRLIIEMCLQIGSNNSMPKSVQIKAISVVGWLIRSKGKVSHYFSISVFFFFNINTKLSTTRIEI